MAKGSPQSNCLQANMPLKSETFESEPSIDSFFRKTPCSLYPQGNNIPRYREEICLSSRWARQTNLIFAQVRPTAVNLRELRNQHPTRLCRISPIYGPKLSSKQSKTQAPQKYVAPQYRNTPNPCKGSLVPKRTRCSSGKAKSTMNTLQACGNLTEAGASSHPTPASRSRSGSSEVLGSRT